MAYRGKIDYSKLALGASIKTQPQEGKTLVFKSDGVYWDDVDPKVKAYELGKTYEKGDLLTDNYNNVFVVKNPFTATRPLDNEIADGNIKPVTYDVDLVYKTIELQNISQGDVYTILLQKPNPNANRDIKVLKKISLPSDEINPFTFDENDTNWIYDNRFVSFTTNGAGLKIPIELSVSYSNNVSEIALPDIADNDYEIFWR